MRVLYLNYVLNLCLALTLAPSAKAFKTGATIRIRKNLSRTASSLSANSNIDETGNPNFLGSTGDDRAINDIISRGFLPSGPEDMVDLSTDITEVSNGPSKRYLNTIEGYSPAEMIQKFVSTAPKNVQAAAKSTVVNILGNLPDYALDAALITTSSKLAKLLHQMQMTGYMFKNAEYRMNFIRPLKGLPRLSSKTSFEENFLGETQQDTRSTNQLTVRTVSGEFVDVDVNELSDALTRELTSLRLELSSIRDEREQELRQNLLTYIQALPNDELMRLTSDVTPEIMETIQMLIDSLMERLGIDSRGPEVVIQQNMGAMAQLCMWQMVMGYKLRELEAMDKGVSLY